MIAVKYDGRLQVREVPMPRPQSHEALIRVKLAGICNTDIEIIRGYMGFTGILGHEFVGVVEACEDATWIGRRVVGEINIGCDRCSACLRGLQRHCPHRNVLGILNKDGAMAEYVTLPVKNLHAVPDSISDQQAVFTEPLAAACEIAEQIHLQPDTEALVIGDGKLGLLIAQVLKHFGLRVSLLGKHENKLQLARKWGIIATMDEKTLAPHFPMVVEATGSPSAFDLAIRKTQPRGKMILKSTYAGNLTTNLAPVVIHEIEVVGSRCGRFEPAMELLRSGYIDVISLITERFPLEKAAVAFEKAQMPGVLKVLLETNSE